LLLKTNISTKVPNNTMKTLDLTAASPQDQLQTLEQAFLTAAPGTEFQLQTSNPPDELLSTMIETYWGQFDWAPLNSGKPHWKTLLRKRGEPLADSLHEFMADDHARCDALFAQAEESGSTGNLAETKQRFQSFLTGMLRHFNMEEKGFFIEFDKRTGYRGGGPTYVMREEHDQLRGLLEQMGGFLDEGNLERYLSAGETMLILMEQHNMKEEHVLYTMADQMFQGECMELIKKLLRIK